LREAFDEAGFKDLEFLKMIIKEDADDQIKVEWADFLRISPVIFFRAYKK
jgi:hypothetical protein